MAGYSKGERMIANALENFPLLRTMVKESYKRLVFCFHRKKGFQCSLHPDVTMQSAFEWAGLAETQDEYFFGYYDKTPWSPDMGKMLLHQDGNQELQVILLDTDKSTRTSLGTTASWNWQQGAMTQWVIIDNSSCIVHNTIKENVLGMKIIRPGWKHYQFIPWPLQALNPKKPEALSINYKRLQQLRECYGYAPCVSNFSEIMDDDSDGIWRVNLLPGLGELIISLQQLKESHFIPEMEKARHKVNHLIYSPSGENFVFLHRFYTDKGRFSRLYAAKPDGTELRLLLDGRMVSHYHWLDDDTVVAWARTDTSGDRYYKVAVSSGKTAIIGEDILEKFGDGHCSVSPDKRFLLTDTYPDKARNQHLIIFDLIKNTPHIVGTFFSPWKYHEFNRCDLHPRWSPDGRLISIDSTHTGTRKSYVLNVKNFLEDLYD